MIPQRPLGSHALFVVWKNHGKWSKTGEPMTNPDRAVRHAMHDSKATGIPLSQYHIQVYKLVHEFVKITPVSEMEETT